MPTPRPLRHIAIPVILLALAGAPCGADGKFFGPPQPREVIPVSAPGQKAVIVRDGASHEILLLQTTYRGPAQAFAWVVPVPDLPSASRRVLCRR